MYGDLTHWVEANIFPSGLKAAAIVDLGGGKSGQYLADKYLNDSASTLKVVKSKGSTQGHNKTVIAPFTFKNDGINTCMKPQAFTKR